MTPIEVVASAEFTPSNLGGSVTWTITGGAGQLPDDAGVLVGIARSGAEVPSPTTESSDRTAAFLEQVGESADAAHVVVRSGTDAGSLPFSLRDTDGDPGAEAVRVHIGVIDNVTSEIVAVKSVPVEILDLSGPDS